MSKKNGIEALSRRAFLASAATVGAGALAAPAFAQSALDTLINAPRRGNWDDQFDAKAASRTATAMVSNTPILGPQSVASAQQAIMQYQQIAAAGGWPEVNPGDQRLQLGVSSPPSRRCASVSRSPAICRARPACPTPSIPMSTAPSSASRRVTACRPMVFSANSR